MPELLIVKEVYRNPKVGFDIYGVPAPESAVAQPQGSKYLRAALERWGKAALHILIDIPRDPVVGDDSLLSTEGGFTNNGRFY